MCHYYITFLASNSKFSYCSLSPWRPSSRHLPPGPSQCHMFSVFIMAPSHLQVPISNTSSLLLHEKLPRKLSGLKRCHDIAEDSVSPEFKDAAVGLSLLCMLSAGFPPVSETSVSHAAVLFPRGWPGPFFYRQQVGRICLL